MTAGIGGLAYAGIPVTHRDTNHAVTFITGHGADGKLPKLDWAAVAKGSPTIVLFMARKHAGEIAAKLIDAGRDAQRTRRHRQRRDERQTGGARDDAWRSSATRQERSPPAIIVIGENVKLREGLDWLGALTRAAC